MDQTRLHAFRRFARQYSQLVDPSKLSWPAKADLRSIESQTWLHDNLFNADAVTYLPPARYQTRVIKRLLQLVEESINDPDEDEISDDLSSDLALLVSSKQPTEATAAQQPSYVTYTYSSGDDIEPRITLLEFRAIIASAGTTGRRTWEAALHLSRYLVNNKANVQGKNILELGAGTGLISIMCARWLGTKHVTATDGDDSVVEDLQKNIFLNGLEDSSKIYAKTLKWGFAIEENEGGQLPDYDVVLGADITYDKSVIPWLVATFRDLFTLKHSIEIIIAATIRNADTFSAFLTACEKNKFSILDVDFPMQPADFQDGPFYATTTPIRIVRITSTGPMPDPFAV